MERFVEEYLICFSSRELKIADIGSQDVNGTYKEIFEKPGWKYFGCDISKGKNVDIVLNNMYNWKELRTNHFDVVISGQSFEHIEYFWITMLEIARILKYGGLCCIIAPSGGFEHKYPLDCWRFYPDGFRALAKYSNIEVLKVYAEWDSKNYPDGSEIWKDTVLIGRKPKYTFKQAIKANIRNNLFKLLV